MNQKRSCAHPRRELVMSEESIKQLRCDTMKRNEGQ